MLAEIALESAVYTIDKPYTYRVPAQMTLLPGMRVTVPFGAGNRGSEGMVLSLREETDYSGDPGKLKEIKSQLDASPILSEELLRTAAFLRERYFCTFYDAVKVILPAGLWLKTDAIYSLTEKHYEGNDPEECRLTELIGQLGGSAAASELKKLLEEDPEPVLAALTRRGYLTSSREFRTVSRDKTEELISLATEPEEAVQEAALLRRRAPVQAAVLEMLAAAGTVSSKELCYYTGATADTLKKLERRELLTRSRQEVFRPAYELCDADADPVELNEEQNEVYRAMSKRFAAGDTAVSLLYGVTGSGKTMIYLRLIRDCIDSGKSALLLVPEISLTPQLVHTMSRHFGKRVAVLHSRLPVGARYDEWKRIRTGNADVVIGTRSAVFAPLKDPGLIIVDEEHEHSYKSENTPRYHGREVAIFRGLRAKVPVVLGSATPSVESMYLAKTGVYHLYTLRSRYNGMSLPRTEIVDMKEELRAGNASPLSRRLQDLLLERSGQSILFLNRRGSGRMMVCVDCGSIPDCPNCSAHLTYHSANERLMCHYCGYSEYAQQKCPECGGHRKTVGFGTQRVQQELEALLPGEEILRMDADTVSAVNSHEKLLSRFQKEDIPVLIGTQMVTKGLNFPRVTLSCVLDADAALYVESFRAAETAFSMITQVAGRAGRGDRPGCAVIQTMTPENRTILQAAAQDYDSFYASELPVRSLRNCPPFADIFLVGFSGPRQEPVESSALLFRGRLIQALEASGVQMQILGPAPAPVARVCGRYRYRLTLTAKNTREIRRLLERLLRSFAKEKRDKDVYAYIDINPYE